VEVSGVKIRSHKNSLGVLGKIGLDKGMKLTAGCCVGGGPARGRKIIRYGAGSDLHLYTMSP